MSTWLDIQNQQVIWGADKNQEPKACWVDELWGLRFSQMWGNEIQSDIASSAWGLSKSITDFSLYSALFTYEIASWQWRGTEDTVEVYLPTSTRLIAENWELKMTTTAVNWSCSEIVSIRSPRYQPNRWHLYSTTIIAPDAETTWATCRWGLWIFDGTNTPENWAYFEIVDWALFAVVRSDWANRSRVDITSKLANVKMPDGTAMEMSDLVNNHLYDIQFQWRGAWDFFFYIDLQLVHRENFLWLLTDVTLANPNLPCFYQIINVTAWAIVTLKSGCADITTEWGNNGRFSPASAHNSELVTLPNDLLDYSFLIFRMNSEYKGLINTRNARGQRTTVIPLAKDMIIKIWVTRDPTFLTWTTWATAFVQTNPNSSIDKIDMSQYTTSEVTVDYTKLFNVFSQPVFKNTTLQTTEINENSYAWLTPWDYLVIYWNQLKTGTGGEVIATQEFWEEI